MKDVLLKIQQKMTLDEPEMNRVMTRIMDGACTDVQISAFLMGLSMRGETAEELTGAARVMRTKAKSVQAPPGAVDCCGTGGDKSGTYNISTAVAIVAAACGVPVAKHGNRASSSKSGAADVLEALGINLDTPQDRLEEALKRYNFAFLMAPKHHEAMKHVMPVRKEMGVRTIFNLLGPLANPAGTKRQLIGVFDRKWLVPMAEALRALGTEKAWIVHGSDGLDEITTTSQTYVAKLESGIITEEVLSSADFGLMESTPEALLGGDARQNAAALIYLLEGGENAYRDIVLANTAAVLMVAEKADTIKDGMALATQAIDSKKALDVLEQYRNFTK